MPVVPARAVWRSVVRGMLDESHRYAFRMFFLLLRGQGYAISSGAWGALSCEPAPWSPLVSFAALRGRNDRALHGAIQRMASHMAASALYDSIAGKLPYSFDVQASSLPSSGLGLFLRGSVPMGSLVALYPGTVFTREEQQQRAKVARAARPGVRYTELFPYLIVRHDELVVDVLDPNTVDANEPLAVGHRANHPPAHIAPSVVDVDVLLPQSIAPFLRCSNTRNLLPGKALVALRDLCDEELFFDYSYALPASTVESLASWQSALPAWYQASEKNLVRDVTWSAFVAQITRGGSDGAARVMS